MLLTDWHGDHCADFVSEVKCSHRILHTHVLDDSGPTANPLWLHTAADVPAQRRRTTTSCGSAQACFTGTCHRLW